MWILESLEWKQKMGILNMNPSKSQHSYFLVFMRIELEVARRDIYIYNQNHKSGNLQWNISSVKKQRRAYSKLFFARQLLAITLERCIGQTKHFQKCLQNDREKLCNSPYLYFHLQYIFSLLLSIPSKIASSFQNSNESKIVK